MPQTREESVRRAVAPVSGRCRTRTPRIYLLTLPTRRAHALLCCAACALFFFLVFTGLTTTTYMLFFVPVAFLYDRVTPKFGFHVYLLPGVVGVGVTCMYLPFVYLFSRFGNGTTHFCNCVVVVARLLLLLLVFLLSALYSHFLEKYKKKTECNEAVPLAQSFVCSRSNSKWQSVSLFVLICFDLTCFDLF